MRTHEHPYGSIQNPLRDALESITGRRAPFKLVPRGSFSSSDPGVDADGLQSWVIQALPDIVGWSTGVGIIEAADTIVREAVLNGNIAPNPKEKQEASMADTADFELVSYSIALAHLKAEAHSSARIARIGWNGKNMWVVILWPGNAMDVSVHGGFAMQPCLALKTADGVMQPGWVPSQADQLTDDWVILP